MITRKDYLKGMEKSDVNALVDVIQTIVNDRVKVATAESAH